MTVTSIELALLVFISNVLAQMVCIGKENAVEYYESKKKKDNTEQERTKCNS